MSGYGPVSSQSSLALTTNEVPAAPVAPSPLNGPSSGTADVTVTVPTLSQGGPPLTVPVSQITLFRAITDISTLDLDSLFASAPNVVAQSTLLVPPAAATVVFNLTSLAPGTTYYFRAAAKN